MKKRNNKVIVLALAGVIFVSLLVVFILNYSKDDSSFSILEKKWINDNASSVIDVSIYNDILRMIEDETFSFDDMKSLINKIKKIDDKKVHIDM